MDVARTEKPHLALVKIRLAGRENGLELAEHLKALGVPVLLISGHASRASSAKNVVVGSMQKPDSAADMVFAVSYLVARLKGDPSLPRSSQLEVFDEEGFGLAQAP